MGMRCLKKRPYCKNDATALNGTDLLRDGENGILNLR